MQFLILEGLESLSIRVEREVRNTHIIVNYLLNHSLVEWVNYPAAPSNINPNNRELVEKYFPKGPGTMFTFGFKGNQNNINKFLNSLKIFSFLVNVGDSKSLIVQPFETTHSSLSEEDKIKAGVFENALRISIGLENVEDLISDLDQAFKKSID